jgi:hypothetical protein
VGGPPSQALDDAVRGAITAGVTVVVAAGNDGLNANQFSPSRVAEAITVGATTSSDARASFSNFGSVLDLFAPGQSIISAYYTSNTATGTLSGTSMAAPHVSGVAALYLEQNGDRPPLEVRNAIVTAATANVLSNVGTGSPNLLLYSAFTIPIGGGAGLNVAAAAAGAVATASSSYSAGYAASAVNNGDRRGAGYGGGGVWHDATGGVYPDWVEIAFAGSKSIDEVAVFTVQDAWSAPSEPTASMTWSQWGVNDFTLQYWTGSVWQTVPNGVVTNNNLVWRSVTFPALTTTKIRVLIQRAADGWSRLTEVEAYQSSGGAPGNTPPSVSITAPAEGATAVAPASFTVAASASDTEGPVSNVAFYHNDNLIAQDSTSPFSVPWNNVAAGSYTLTAVATDAGGLATTSAPVHVTVTSPGSGGTNVAAATQGAVATASSAFSGYPASAVNDGDRRGTAYGGGGVWHDATGNVYPDTVDITFAGSRTIDQVAVFTVQDAWNAPSEPTPSMTWSQWGVHDFTVQYWTGSNWQALPGGVILNNNLVWRTLAFTPVTTTAIRVAVQRAADGWSRLTEIEAYHSGGGGTPGNTPPSVTITAPAEGTAADAPASFTVSANASDAEGPVSSVAFYQNGNLIAQDNSSPFSVPWTNVAAGNYTLTAVASDAGGLSTTSAAVHVTVTGSGAARINVAAAAQGATVSASSAYSGGYAASAVINGDRRGTAYGAGGVWHDATDSVYPDWVEITFAGSKTIDEVAVFTVQDAWSAPSEPTPGMTWSLWGVNDFTVQYWTGSAWQTVPGGAIVSNNLVWRAITFAPITTTRIRVVAHRAADGWSRLTEIEALQVP